MRSLPSCVVLCCAVSAFCLTAVTSTDSSAASPSAKITFDLHKNHAVTETLWGIFFEEVGHELIRRACDSCCDLPARAALHTVCVSIINCTLDIQIQHAGDGGLYAELVQDRQFGGLAYSIGLYHTSAEELQVPAAYHQADYLPLAKIVQQQNPSVAETNLTGVRRWRQNHALPEYR